MKLTQLVLIAIALLTVLIKSKKKMKQPIHKLIGHTEESLDKVIFETMFNWAGLYCDNSSRRMQILLANRKINNWFHAELKRLIILFRTDLAESELRYKTTTKDRLTLFVTTITKVYDIYPKALITQIKATENIIIDKNFSNN